MKTSKNIALFTLSVTFPLISTFLPANAALDAEGTINFSSRVITVDGAINSNDNIINAILLDVPSERWTVEKNELNNTEQSWFGWEITFGDNTIIPSDANVSSNIFNQVSIFPNSNRIVFFDGEVAPDETLFKSFEVLMPSFGDLTMAHNRITTLPTVDQINNGFPQLPEVDVAIELQTVSEPFSILGLLALGTLGTVFTLKRHKKQNKDLLKLFRNAQHTRIKEVAIAPTSHP